MSEVHKLVGERYASTGRKTGETPVTLWRGQATEDVLLTVGNREVFVHAGELRAAVLALTMPGEGCA